MSYTASVSGSAGSKSAEAKVLVAFASFVERSGSAGTFSFVGDHFHIAASPAEDATKEAHKLVQSYDATADADDKTTSKKPAADVPASEPEPADAVAPAVELDPDPADAGA